MPNKICPICKSEFSVKPSHFRKIMYCSRACMAAGYMSRMSNESNPNFRHGGFCSQKECKFCGKEFLAFKPHSIYCSRECASKAKETKKEYVCEVCGKAILFRTPRKYCSIECNATGKIKNQNKYKTSRPHKCKNCGTIIKGKSVFCSKKCRVGYNNKRAQKTCPICFSKYWTYKSKIKKYCSYDCAKKAQALRQSGELSHLWKGGLTQGKKRIRTHPLYDQWRSKVFTRDGFTCQACGWKSCDLPARKMTAHHIIPFSVDPKKSLKISNGITLCWSCHSKLHWGSLVLDENTIQKAINRNGQSAKFEPTQRVMR